MCSELACSASNFGGLLTLLAGHTLPDTFSLVQTILKKCYLFAQIMKFPTFIFGRREKGVILMK